MKSSKQLAKCALALAIGLAVTQATLAEDDKPAEGFIEGSTLDMINRNYYLRTDYHNKNGPNGGQHEREEWAQGVMVNFKSGFTQGVVGFGVDAHAFGGLRLDSGGGRSTQTGYPFGLLSVDKDFDPEESYGEVGGAVKMRVSKTEVKYGEMRTAAPVFGTGDTFLLPETATGFHIASDEIENLSLEAGHFTAYNHYNSTNSGDELLLNYGGGKVGQSMDYAGGTYTFTDNFSVMAYYADFKDTWIQYFTNVAYSIPLAENQKLGFDFNAYDTRDTGKSYQGDINNLTYSFKTSYEFGAHTVAVAYQTVNGDTPFDYVGYDSIWLSNSMQLSDFNGPEEKSLSLAYKIDMTDFGVPGMTIETKYTGGDNIDGSNADPTGGYAFYGNNGKHWERDFDVKYKVQDGAAKDLSFRLRYGTHRANTDQSERDMDEIRFVVEYPISIL